MTPRRRLDGTIRAFDLFCGAGGLSTGLALACEDLDVDVELVAINHWDVALDTHEANHPWATHLNAKVEELEPREVFPGERLDILAAAPECQHYSNARGGRPVNEQKRASPWHILRWLEHLYVDHILVENVPEFENWGPVGADGQPMQSKKGETFRAWIRALTSLGYSVDWRVLNAADYGDPTTRRRLFVIGCRQGSPAWPKPTHSEGGTEPGTEPWRPARAIIDWSDPGESIWARNRPLASSTMARIAEGIRRYAHPALAPYADILENIEPDDVEAMQNDAVPAGDVPNVVEARGDPFLVVYYGTSHSSSVEEPAPTVTAQGGKIALCVPYLLGQHSGSVARVVEEPCMTVAAGGAISLVQPATYVLPPLGYYARNGKANRPRDPGTEPLQTITASRGGGHLVSSHLVPFFGERANQDPRTHDLGEPLPAVTSHGAGGLCNAYLVSYYGNGGPEDPDDPLPTLTTRDRFALVVPDLYPYGLDVRFRMLQPAELAAAMGFPPGYTFSGNKTETVRQIGNAVCVNLAKALCTALLSDRVPSLDEYGLVGRNGGGDE